MMACLPVLGLLPGGIWALAAFLLPKLNCPLSLQGIILGMIPWVVTGFLHLDGYMDVCDAILSRRDLETRQRILKDSHCGAFAVICMVLLAMVTYGIGTMTKEMDIISLLLVPVASRICASFAVTHLRPLGSSQYAKMDTYGRKNTVWLVMCAVCVLGLPWCFGHSSFAVMATMMGYGLACRYGYKNLDGMSGDISGFSLVIGECVGFLVAGLM